VRIFVDAPSATCNYIVRPFGGRSGLHIVVNADRKKPSTQLGVAPEASPRADSRAPGSNGAASAAWTGLSWKSLLGLDDAPPRKPAVEVLSGSRPSETRRASKTRLSASAGFYSTKPEADEATVSVSPPVTIPKPPGLPADLLGPAQQVVPGPVPAAESDGPPPPSTAFAHFPPPFEPSGPVEGGAPALAHFAAADSSLGAAPSKAADASSGAGAAQARPVLQFPDHIREQAAGWLRSGSLSLPNCSSPRHARAMQRALLLALLERPGYERLPLGLKQRVGWLLSPGWERQTTGSVASEASDLMTVLCLASGPSSLQGLMSALRQLIPNPLPLVRPPSSYPPARR